jgi:pyruvate ferredoxin oxidoreductase gamma subunit
MDLTEIRIHGRGGQGNVLAAELLALAAFDDGYEVQAFPAFGAERTGSPVQAFVRLANKPIRVRSQVYEPDVVIVQDPGLARTQQVFTGLRAGGIVVLNAESRPVLFPADASARMFTVPATRIASELLGKPIPNSVMLGAFVAATRLISLDSLLTVITERFGAEVAVRNVAAASAGYEQVSEVRGWMPSSGAAASSPRGKLLADSVLQAGSSRGYPTGGWRTLRPVFQYQRCNGCDICALYCPEGIITARTRTEYVADYDFCKGCGICAQECPVKDIVMVPEASFASVA